MIIFSSADMEASRGAIHKRTEEPAKVQSKSPYEKSRIRKSAARIGTQVVETTRKNTLYAVAIAALIGFLLGTFSDVRRRKSL